VSTESRHASTSAGPASAAAGTRPAVVSARELAVSYGRAPVWSGATFDLRPGEFVGVLGPNGAGKSTLLRLILGLVPPSGGSLEVLGAQPRRGNRAIGYVPQRRPIDPDLRLRATEFVRMGLTGHRWGTGVPGRPSDVRRRVDAAVAAVGAGAFAGGPIGTLSGGELQRLMLAQAIVGDPALLLLDEPLASLDVRNQVAVAGLVSGLARSRGLAVLLIAHDVNPLLPVLDRVIYVARGQVAIGRPEEVVTAARLSALYGTPVEVLRDSSGRLFVVGLEEEAAHPHPHAHDVERPVPDAY